MFNNARFCDAKLYISRHQFVSQLLFDVKVWKSAANNGQDIETLAERRIQWGVKLPSPKELIRDLHSNTCEEQLNNQLSNQKGHNAETRLYSYLTIPFGGESNTPADRRAPQHGDPADPLAPPQDAPQVPPPPPELGHIFTRPPTEGFVDPEELVCEVWPEQEVTPLTESEILGCAAEGKQSRGLHTFYLMFAEGTTKATNNRPIGWSGYEYVLVSLRELAEGQFVAKPALNEEHVLRYGASDIIHFQVSIAGAAQRTHAAPGEQMTPPIVSPPRVPLASIGDPDNAAPDDAAEGGKKKKKKKKGKDANAGAEEGSSTTGTTGSGGNVPPIPLNGGAMAPDGNQPQLHSDTGGMTDEEFQEYTDEMTHRRNRLRQLLTAGTSRAVSSAGSLTSTALSPESAREDAIQKAVARFTFAPGTAVRRVHFFGTIDFVNRVEADEIFVQLHFLLPPRDVNIDAEINRKTGVLFKESVITQTAQPHRALDEENGTLVTQHIINFPWEFHCLMSYTTPYAARIVFEVWSKLGERRQQIEGYGALTLAPVPGMHKKEIGLWRPSMSGSEQLKHLFVGGAPCLVETEEAAIPYKRREALLHADEKAAMVDPEPVAMNCRAGLTTQSTGSIKTSFMCAVQTRNQDEE